MCFARSQPLQLQMCSIKAILRRSELQYVLEDSQSAAVLTTEDYANKLAPLADKANIQLHLLRDSSNPAESSMSQIAKAALSQSQEDIGSALDAHFNDLSLKQSDGALIVYTSGTTGRPKGESHRSGNGSCARALLCNWCILVSFGG